MSSFTEQELDDIEQELLGTNDQDDNLSTEIVEIKTHEPINNIVDDDVNDYEKPKKRKPKKARLIDDIMKLKDASGQKYSKRDLQRSKVSQLEYILKETFREQAGQAFLGKLPENVEAVDNIQISEPTNQPIVNVNSPLINSYGPSMLFQINLVASVIAEKVTDNYKEDIGGSFEGFTDTLKENREELMPILEEIYRENQSALQEVCNPWVAYGLFMVGTGASCYKPVDNFNKITETVSIDGIEYLDTEL